MPSKPEKHFATILAIATLFKRSTAEIELHCRRDGMPHRGKKGGVRQFDLAEAVQWYVDYQRRQLEEEKARRNIRSLGEIADLFGKVQERTINLRVKNDGLPRLARGEYDLTEVVPWHVKWYERQLKEAKAGGETERDVRKRNLIAAAELKEYELAILKGALSRIDDFTDECIKIVIEARQILLGVPKHAARETGNKELEAYLQPFINRTLNVLASIPDRLKRLASDKRNRNPEDLRRIQAAAEIDGKPMGRSKANAQRGSKRRKRAMGHK